MSRFCKSSKWKDFDIMSSSETFEKINGIITLLLSPDPVTARNRQEAMERARQKMQEEHDARAAKAAEDRQRVREKIKFIYIQITPSMGFVRLHWSESCNLNQNVKFFFEPIHFEMASTKWCPFCSGLNVLTHCGWVRHMCINGTYQHCYR